MKRIGVSLIEVVMATTVLGTVMMGFVLFQTATIKSNQSERDRAFAMQKAIQIMEELKVYSAADGAAQLDNYGQSDTTYSWNLTTENVPQPSDALSDNTPAGSGYRYVRQIWVRPLPRDKGARQVTVRLFLSNLKSQPGITAGSKPVASVANTFKSLPIVVLPSQAYEFYRIAMWEFTNSPHPGNSYQYPTLYSSYGGTASSYLQNANPGLDLSIRQSVSVAAYGRDTYYAPLHNYDDYWAHINSGYPNATAGSDVTSPDLVPFNNVYFRPGMYGSDQGQRLIKGGGQGRTWSSSEGNQQYEPLKPNFGLVIHTPTAAKLYENQAPYTFADEYNHALRYVEHNEKAAVRGVTSPASRKAPQLTLRTLLDELIAGKRKNAMIVNDHSENFPMIPLRNYSDAAKVPGQHWDLADLASMWGVTPGSANDAKKGAKARLVTHPYKLEYETDDVIEMRVFPYKASDVTEEPPAPYRNAQVILRGMGDDLANWNSAGGAEQDVEIQYCAPLDLSADNVNTNPVSADDYFIRTFCKDFPDKRDPAVWIANYSGNLMAHLKTYRWVRIWPPGAASSNSLRPTNSEAKGKGMGKAGNAIIIPYSAKHQTAHLASNVAIQASDDAAKGLLKGDVIIKLKDIPYTHPQIKGKYSTRKDGDSEGDLYAGLKSSTLLHQMNYFPDPAMPDMSEDHDLSTDHPRNTARFRVLFKSKTAKTVEVITTIGDEVNLNRHQAPNRSRTWAWVKAPGAATTVPDTEQFQLIGDPRHNPYKDVRDDRRYNRYFGDLDDAYFTESDDLDWNYFADTANGWGPNTGSVGRADVDVPRYFELWRRALLNSNSMLGSVTANAFKYVVLGSEYNAVPHSKFPMTGQKNQKFTYDERDNPTLVADKNGNGWYAKPWLGELYPDDRWDAWIDGNLPSDDFRRLEIQDINTFPDEVQFKRTRKVDHWGPMSFYNSSSRFAFRDAVGKGTLTSDSGRAVTADLKALLRETVDLKFSFTLNDNTLSTPSDWNSSESQATRTTIESGVVSGAGGYYKASADGNHAIAPFTMRRTENGKTKAAYFLGFTPTSVWGGANDPISMQRVFMSSMLQGFMDMASPTFNSGANKGSQRIKLLPRLKVTAPEDDAVITGSVATITWQDEWVRWDGQPYSRQFDNYGSTGDKPDLAYFVKYSEDGSKWYFANSSPITLAEIGVNARYNAVTNSYATTNRTVALNVSGFKNKQYQVRIEAWRTEPGYEGVHHAYSQISINVAK